MLLNYVVEYLLPNDIYFEMYDEDKPHSSQIIYHLQEIKISINQLPLSESQMEFKSLLLGLIDDIMHQMSM